MKKLTGKLILLLNIIAAAALLLSYLASFVNPAKMLFPAFFGLAYPYLLLFNVIFMVYWIIRFRKEVLISLIVILLGWTHLMNFMPFNFNADKKNTDPEKEILQLMSYNVRTFDQYNWSKKEKSRDGMFNSIQESNADIVCIQEFYSANKTGLRERDVKRKLSDFPNYSIYYSMKTSPRTGFGIATFSKHKIVKTSRIPFNNTVNQAVYTDIKIDQDTIRVFNIHLQSIKFGQRNYSFIDTLSFKQPNKQIEEVKDIGKRLKNAFVLRAEQSNIIHNYIKASPYPVIVAGDFNDTPISYAYRKINKGLSDAFRKNGKGFGNTYAGELPSFRIDYILYSSTLDATQYRRIKTKFSDHFPITASFKWKEIEPDSPKPK